jgi:bla regulator protein BlaR1
MNFIENLNTIAEWVFINTLKASVLVGLILLIQYLFRRRIPAKWHYALWLVLIARLLLPAGFESQLSLYNLLNDRPETIENFSHTFTQTVWQSSVGLRIQEEPLSESIPSQNASLTIVDVLVIVWAIGVLMFIFFTFTGNIKFWLRIRKRELVNNNKILLTFNDCLQRMHIRRRISLEHLPQIQIPMVYGWLRPVILLPTAFIGQENEESLKHILCHELAHIKRHDIPVAYLTTMLQVLHWFNPVMWWAFYKIRLDREVACDAIALNHLGRDQAKSYGHTILSLLEHISTENLMPITVGIIESKKNLKRRLSRIIQFRKPKLIWNLLAILVFSTITVAGLSEANNKEKDRNAIIINITKEAFNNSKGHEFDGKNVTNY